LHMHTTFTANYKQLVKCIWVEVCAASVGIKVAKVSNTTTTNSLNHRDENYSNGASFPTHGSNDRFQAYLRRQTRKFGHFYAEYLLSAR
jgi:hypothetical protein